MLYTEVKNYFVYDSVILAAEGSFYRLRLGLGHGEVARIMQVSFHLSPNGLTQFFQAISGDPDEEANLGLHQITNDQNLIAIRGIELLGVTAQGPLALDTKVIPVPGHGIDVAGDVVYAMGVAENIADCLHGCSVYYERRKAKPNEREALIMAQR